MKNIFLILGVILLLVGVYQIATHEWVFIKSVWSSSFVLGLDISAVLFFSEKNKRHAEKYLFLLTVIMIPCWYLLASINPSSIAISIGALLIFIGFGFIAYSILMLIIKNKEHKRKIELENEEYQRTDEIG